MNDTFVGTFTVSLQDDRILLPSHGLIDGDQVRFALGAAGNIMVVPIVEGTFYFVVESRGNDFRVASTAGAIAIDLTDRGTGSNEVWKSGEGNPTWQMSSTVTAELPPKDFAMVKLIV